MLNSGILISNESSPFFPDEKRSKKIEAVEILAKIQLTARKTTQMLARLAWVISPIIHVGSIEFLNTKISNAETEHGTLGIYSKKNYRQHVGFEFSLRAYFSLLFEYSGYISETIIHHL